MALLTNINGKFSVSDAGAVRFNNAFTFPTADGTANYFLQTNGSGTIGWAAAPTGSGAANRVAYWTTASNISYNDSFQFDGSNVTITGRLDFIASAATYGPYITSPDGKGVQIDYNGNSGGDFEIWNHEQNGGAAVRMFYLSDDQTNLSAIFGSTARDVDVEIIGDIKVDGTFKDSSGDVGTAGQILSSTATGTNWINNSGGTITGSGAANRVTYWDSATNVTSDAGFTYNGAGRVSTDESFNVVKDGADTTADGPFFALKNAAGTRQYLNQLDASNNIDYWYYNGSAWTQTISLLNNGGAIFTGTGTFGDAVIVTGSYPGLVLDNPSNTKFALTNRHTDNRMSFDVTPQGGSTVEVMNLVSTGLGIGTASPGSYDAEGDNLVIYDSVTPGITIALPQTTAASSARGSILFSDGTSGSEKYRGGVIYDHGTAMGGLADTMYLRAAIHSYLVLDPTGKVGIGTKTPVVNLHVQSTGIPTIAQSSSSSITSGSRGDLAWYNSSISTVAMIRPGAVTDNVGTDLQFYTRPVAGALTERMRITHDGDVFIGNSSVTTANTAIFLNKSGIITNVLANSGGTTDLMQFYQQNGGGIGTLSRNASGICMNGNGQTNQLIAADSGKVGIGTTSLEGKLTIQYTSADPPTSGTTANSAIQILSNLSPPHQLNIGVVNAPSYGSYIQASDNNLAVNYPLLLQPNGGNVGIGTTSPSFQLSIENHDTTTSTATMELDGKRTNGTDGPVGEMIFSNNGDTFATVAGYRDSADNKGALYFQTQGASGFSTKMIIRNSARIEMSADVTMSGSVGIGETTLQRKFNLYDGTDTWTRVQCGASTADWLHGIAGSDHTYKWYNQSSNGGVGYKMALATSGALTVSSDVVAYGSPSDKRLKENIKPIESALDKVSRLQGVTFDWKKSDSILDIKEDIGFIAQDVQKVIPELVRENNNGMLSMRHQGIAPILLEAIKELKAEIEELKKQIK